jgi:hypothetical protein
MSGQERQEALWVRTGSMVVYPRPRIAGRAWRNAAVVEPQVALPAEYPVRPSLPPVRHSLPLLPSLPAVQWLPVRSSNQAPEISNPSRSTLSGRLRRAECVRIGTPPARRGVQRSVVFVSGTDPST